MTEGTSNLLQETIICMEKNGATPDNVRWVGSREIWATWDEFAAVADFDYDDGYGGQVVAADLLIVGDDWWMERHEYDGSEWWEFKRLPDRPADHRTLRSVRGGFRR